MKRTEIDARFTQEVVSYIAMGYTVNTETMRGSQGEIAKVDLVKGNDFIRVLLQEASDVRLYSDKIQLVVGRIPESKWKNGWTVWNSDMDVIRVEEWYRANPYRLGNYYFSKEEAEAASELRQKRWENRIDPTVEFNLEKAAPIVKPFVNRQKGCKSARLANIKRVYKTFNREGKASYHIDTRNHSFKLA